jgi:hypothetical protein
VTLRPFATLEVRVGHADRLQDPPSDLLVEALASPAIS